MATPMASGGAFIGWEVAATTCDGTNLDAVTGYYDVNHAPVSDTLPSGWVPYGGTGGGGGGTSTVFDYFVLSLPSGTVLNDTRYPDHGVPGLANNDRIMSVDIPSPYTTGTWRKISAYLTNVQAAIAVTAVTVTIRNITDGTSVASLTFAIGASPDARHKIRSTATIASGTITDGKDLQWHVESAPSGNAYGLDAIGTYQLS